jgi:molecular chaperone GrpE
MKKDEDKDIVSEDVEVSKGGDDGEFLDDSVVAEENALEALKKLKEKFKKSQAERMEYLAGWQRAKADLINARKRDEEERKELVRFSNERLIEDLIPALDHFDMAMANKELWEKVDKNWRVGVEYIAQNLKKVLEDYGLKEINPLNEKFDVIKHESIGHVQVSDKNDIGKVVEVASKGFSLNGKIIKVPKVKVGE